MSRVLLLVPHQDDELLVGGPMLVNLCRGGHEVYVFLATNGDFFPFESAARARESIRALTLLGVDRSRILFGGYGDDWRGGSIYDAPYDEVKTSMAGFQQTHGPAPGIDEWRYLRTKEHAPYTKAAYREDLFTLMDSLRPEVLLLIGYDFHPDHRTLHLLSLEALALLMEKDPSYTPVLLEKYAYMGNLFGAEDFFRIPHLPSVRPKKVLDTAFFDWKERIRYRVPRDCDTFFLAFNRMFRAARCYRTQGMWMSADKIINTDVVYWQRNTANRVLGAEIRASSGQVRWLNDLKLFESDSVSERTCDLASLCFRPDPADEEKTVTVTLRAPSDLKLLLLYFNTPGGISVDLEATLFLEDGSEAVLREAHQSRGTYSVLRLELDGRACLGFRLRFENVRGELGLGEIEALDRVPEPPFRELLAEPRDTRYSVWKTRLLWPEKKLYRLLRKLRKRIRTPFDRKKERYRQARLEALAQGKDWEP